jgi:uroporphyrinogen decarboxylase
VPFVYSLAAKIAQMPLGDMVHEPAYFANSLEASYKLFKYDGITNAFDSTIEAEAIGCQIAWAGDYGLPTVIKGCDLNQPTINDLTKSNRLSILLEVTKRLGITLGKEIALIGVVTGPLSLTRSLIGEFEVASGLNGQRSENQKALSLSSEFLKRYVKDLCESGIDAVFFREEITGISSLANLALVKDIYATLFNIIRYYNGFPLLVVRNFELEGITKLHELLKPSGLVLCGNKLCEDSLRYLKKLAESLSICFGLPIPISDQMESGEMLGLLHDFILKSQARGFFYTTDGEISPNIDIGALHNIADRMQVEFVNRLS